MLIPPVYWFKYHLVQDNDAVQAIAKASQRPNSIFICAAVTELFAQRADAHF